tara:strand:- start:25011 stop:25265 length:255 start_codon:yes stop_codon:yes gene_type:complete
MMRPLPYNLSILKLKLDHSCEYLEEAKAYRDKYDTEYAVEYQHKDICHVLSTLQEAYKYIERVSEEEQRQGTSSQVSGVFAVSS